MRISKHFLPVKVTASSKCHEVWNYVLLTELPWLRPLWFSVFEKSLSSRYDRQTDKRSWQTEKRSWQTEKNIPYRQTKNVTDRLTKKRSWLTEKRSWQRETDKCQRQTDKTAYLTDRKNVPDRETQISVPDRQTKKHSWQRKNVPYWQISVPERQTDKYSLQTERWAFLTDRQISVPGRRTDK